MHEARLLRDQEKLVLGQEDKIQWGDFLRAFCQLQKGRMEIALESLTNRQLDMLDEAIQVVREDVMQSSLEKAKLEITKLGLDPQIVARFLSGESFEQLKEEPQSSRSKVSPISAAQNKQSSQQKAPTASYKAKYGKTLAQIVEQIVKEKNLPLPVTANQVKDAMAGSVYDDIPASKMYSACYEYNKKHGTSIR